MKLKIKSLVCTGRQPNYIGASLVSDVVEFTDPKLKACFSACFEFQIWRDNFKHIWGL